MSLSLARLKKRELPGDVSAPKNYSRDFRAFKDYEVLPVIRARKAEMDGFYLFSIILNI